jgi:hypothetical protein
MECCDHTDGKDKIPQTAPCPINGKSYGRVSPRTVLHQVRKPWARQLGDQAYYFCSDPDCDVVYFARDDTLIKRHELRQAVGQKSTAADRPLCYCFDISLQDLLPATGGDHGDCRAFVIRQTQGGNCDCEVRNPSGRCCLKEFPKG